MNSLATEIKSNSTLDEVYNEVFDGLPIDETQESLIKIAMVKFAREEVNKVFSKLITNDKAA